MKVSYKWLQDYFDEKLPPINELAETLSLKAFEVENIEGDILDVDVLPNRSHDALSYIGLAKEIAILFDIPLKLPQIKYEKSDKKTSDYVTLNVEDSKLVPRAMKRVVLEVEVKDSPDWLKERLNSIGQKSINNIVDITNFVMWETGQPVHAFDLGKIQGGEIIIRGAKEGEEITTLDNQDFKLQEGMLVIADKEKALDIAGTKGGNNSGIDKNTKNVVLSVCNFNSTSIRNTSLSLGLRTDASIRFSAGISPYLTEVAMERLSSLINELAEGKVSEEVLDIKINSSAEYKIGVSLEEINKILGCTLKESEVEEILNRLKKYAGFEWTKVNPIEKVLEEAPKYVGVPYKYGASITFDSPHYFDCSSYISYIFVQAGISLPRLSVEQYLYTDEIKEEDVRPGDLVFSKGKKPFFYKETPEGLGHVGLVLADEKVIHATSSKDNSVMIEDLKSSSFRGEDFRGYRRVYGLENDRYVVSIPAERLDLRAGPGFLISGNKEDLIEEIGRIYGYSNVKNILPKIFPLKVNKVYYYIQKTKDLLVDMGFGEVITYSFQNEGKIELVNPLASDKKYLRESLKNGLNASLDLNKKNASLLGLDEVKIFEIGKIFKKEGESLSLGIAVSGRTDLKEVADKLNLLGIRDVEITNGILLAMINEKDLPDVDSYEDLRNDLSQSKYEPFSQYPFVLRDVALWVPKSIEETEVENVIKDSTTELLKTIRLFDVYEKDDKISYAFNLVFQSNDKTLTDVEVGEIMHNLEKVFNKKEWQVR